MSADRRIQWIARAIPTVAVLAAGWLLVAWFASKPPMEFDLQVPGMDDPHGRRAKAAEQEPQVVIGEHFKQFDGSPAESNYRWPNLHGPDYDNISTQAVSLADRWPEEGPPVLWSVDLGEGHAAAAILDGRVYVLDHIEEESADALRCFSLDDGAEIWRRSYRVNVKRNHGLSRTVPAVTPRYAVTIGPRCHVMCVDSISGDFKWGIDLVKQYGSKIPGWYTGQCPIIEDGLAILAPAGTNVLMMAVDCEDGEVRWQAPNPDGWQMSHSSIRPMTVSGKKMYVYAAIGGVVGVSAEGDDRGRILWQTSAWAPSVIAPSPVAFDDGRLFVTAGYAAGSAMFKVRETDGQFEAELLYEGEAGEILSCEQQTPILLPNNHLFGILPKDAGELRQQFACYDAEGRLVWTSGKTHRYGLGPFMIADNKFFILDDDGTLTLAEVSLEEFRPLTVHRVIKGHDAWGPLAIAGRRLLLRDSEKMVCIDVGR